MTEVHYGPGDLLFAEGSQSGFVLLITAGEAEVSKLVGGQDVQIGTAKPGDFIGEMGVIENRPRGASVRATKALTAELFGRDEFLQKVSHDPQVAFQLLRRLSERLNAIDESFASLQAGQQDAPGEELGNGAAAAQVAAYKPLADARAATRLVLRPGTEILAASLPAQQIVLERLPYVVGRMPGPGEAAPPITVDLMLSEGPPHRLSRAHFWLEARPGASAKGHAIRDLGSALGTQVNGTPIGHNFSADDAPLQAGENEIIAGGAESPYVFMITLETA